MLVNQLTKLIKLDQAGQPGKLDFPERAHFYLIVKEGRYDLQTLISNIRFYGVTVVMCSFHTGGSILLQNYAEMYSHTLSLRSIENTFL